MNPIFQSLSSGIDPNEVLNFLIKKFPKLNKGIRQAQKTGYSIEQILGFLSDKMESEYQYKYLSANQIEDKKKDEYRAKLNQALKAGAVVGTTALSALALGRVLPKALQSLASYSTPLNQGNLQSPNQSNPIMGLNSTNNSIPIKSTPITSNQPGPQPGVNQPAQALKQTMQLPAPQSTNQPQQPPAQNSQPQASSAIELPQKPPPASKSDKLWDVLTTNKRINTGDPQDNEFLRIAKKLQKVGDIQDRTQFEDLYKQYEFTKNKTQKPGDLEKYLDYVNKQKKQQNAPAQQPQPIQPEIGNLPEKTDSTIPIKQKQEKELALSPSGKIGELESSENGIAKINLENKVKAYKDAEVVKEPILARNAVHDILEIPESERSGPLDLVDYDPIRPALLVQFPNGRTVVYLGASREDAEAIKIGKGIPKTSGKTASGEEWTAGIADSRGAEFSQRIAQNPKYSKANEGITWYYLDKIYDKYNKLRLKPKPKAEKKQPNRKPRK